MKEALFSFLKPDFWVGKKNFQNWALTSHSSYKLEKKVYDKCFKCLGCLSSFQREGLCNYCSKCFQTSRQTSPLIWGPVYKGLVVTSFILKEDMCRRRECIHICGESNLPSHFMGFQCFLSLPAPSFSPSCLLRDKSECWADSLWLSISNSEECSIQPVNKYIMSPSC